MRAVRRAWFVGQPDLDPSRLVFINATGTTANMTRGRCAWGERLRSAVPHGDWQTTTFVVGLRLFEMVAPFVLDGPVNRKTFQAYADQVLVTKSARHKCYLRLAAACRRIRQRFSLPGALPQQL